MMSAKKKTAPETVTSGAKTKRKFNIEDSIADMPYDVKPCTKVYQMTSYQCSIICAVWRWAKTREQLVTELKKLKFCTVDCAIDYLVKAAFIEPKDKEVLEEML